MAKRKRKSKGKREASKRPSNGDAKRHVLDQLCDMMERSRGADADSSYAARVLSRGAHRIAKKVGEEAIEALIEGIRGDRRKLVGESVDLLYHLITLWVSVGIKPRAVWSELDRREHLLAASKTAAK
jgi:phosphoribosyl-ATP pyrophosphohydrolase